MGATRARIRRLESRIGATGDPYQGFTFGDYVKAADAGMKVSEAPLGLQRMHRSMQLTALACELRRTGVEEGIEVGDLETAIVEVGRSFGLPRDLIDKEIAHNRARYTEEVAISCAQVEARARGAASAARERIDAEGRQANWGGAGRSAPANGDEDWRADGRSVGGIDLACKRVVRREHGAADALPARPAPGLDRRQAVEIEDDARDARLRAEGYDAAMRAATPMHPLS